MTEQFQQAVFAGGGSRCFWQLGFWDGANQAGLNLADSVTYAASTSAGCAIATAALLGRTADAFDLFRSLSDANPQNLHWQNLAPWKPDPLLPHMAMYRRALNQFLSKDDLQRLEAKRLEFLMARIPSYLPKSLAAILAFSTYGVEKRCTGRVHPGWTRQLGFQPLVWGNQDARDVTDFINMILASSSVPPVLPTPNYRGERILDGGIIDNTPAFLADQQPGKTLVLLSKRFINPMPQHPTRIYVQPSQPITLDKFDYANPDGLQAVYELGRTDGQHFAEHWVKRPADLSGDEPIPNKLGAI